VYTALGYVWVCWDEMGGVGGGGGGGGGGAH